MPTACGRKPCASCSSRMTTGPPNTCARGCTRRGTRSIARPRRSRASSSPRASPMAPLSSTAASLRHAAVPAWRAFLQSPGPSPIQAEVRPGMVSALPGRACRRVCPPRIARHYKLRLGPGPGGQAGFVPGSDRLLRQPAGLNRFSVASGSHHTGFMRDASNAGHADHPPCR